MTDMFGKYSPGLDLPSPQSAGGDLSPVSQVPQPFDVSVPPPAQVANPVPTPAAQPNAPVPAANDVASSQNRQTVATSGTQVVEDSAVIDKEWIDRARELVERSHADPFALSNQIGVLKAQYIKARYNKEIRSVQE